MNHKCPRTLDKPILLLGLEMEDLGVLILLGGGGGVLFGPVIPGIMTIVGWAMIWRFKRDKPSGYLLHWLYMHGSQLPGLIPSPKKVRYYGAIR